MGNLTNCRDCGKEISKKAKSCPKCGSPPPRKTSLITWLVAIFVCAPFLYAIFTTDYSSAGSSKKEVMTESSVTSRDQEIRASFSSWDGSHRQLEKLIKDNLGDPGSYEHIETGYIDKDNYLLVRTKYRAANAFGGKSVETVTAKVDLGGTVLEIVSE